MLNAITYIDKFPLLRISDYLAAMSGSTYFSTLDMPSSFNQVPIDPRDRDKTAFLTRRGQLRHKVMPMGCSNSPSTFARLMSMVIKCLTWVSCICYIDDTVMVAQSLAKMVSNLEEVLDMFRQSNLKLMPSKCKLFQNHVKFLGHVVSSQGRLRQS